MALNTRALRVGIVGCGLIGRKRAEALGNDALIASYDIVADHAIELAKDFGGLATTSLDQLLELDLDVVIVATIHSEPSAIACQALEAGAHVLVEKPAGIGVADIDRLIEVAQATGRSVKVGFNHRFHPGIMRAVREARSGSYGEVFYLRRSIWSWRPSRIRKGVANPAGAFRRRRNRRSGHASPRSQPLASR